MAEVERRDLSSDADDGELKDMIEHWVAVIDRWVQRIDSGLDGAADDGRPVDRRPASDSAPDTEPASG
ncbi:MAG TPA: hypothetical protein VNF26_03870 [Candidatus Baltobacterales bacterium]|nr:hypothetical protein [Candidatus Baltobacterales bacterium]